MIKFKSVRLLKGHKNELKAIQFALLAALFYGLSSPVSKMLLTEIPPALMAALLYLGAGFSMFAANAYNSWTKREQLEASLTPKELPFIVAMILLDIVAPISLMLGLTLTTASNVALLNNFEIVATAVIALFVFKEAVGKRMWLAILSITLSSVLLTLTDAGSFSFSLGSFFVLLACIAWGFENNCTRMLSIKNPMQIVMIKGFGSGFGALIITGFNREGSGNMVFILLSLLLGALAYGVSILLYIKAQRELGAARTSAFYATAPFIGVISSWIVLKEPITTHFLSALAVMLLGTYFAITEDHSHAHIHNKVSHVHAHRHDDGHHENHHHSEGVEGIEHIHEHVHEPTEHTHHHSNDIHHSHRHG